MNWAEKGGLLLYLAGLIGVENAVSSSELPIAAAVVMFAGGLVFLLAGSEL